MRETDRVEAFSDSVMAVIITLMAFNVKPPNGTTLVALRGDLPELLDRLIPPRLPAIL